MCHSHAAPLHVVVGAWETETVHVLVVAAVCVTTVVCITFRAFAPLCPTAHSIRLSSSIVDHGWELTPPGVDEPIRDLICESKVSPNSPIPKPHIYSKANTSENKRYLLIWRPVFRINSCFSSSVGYGCWRWATNHALSLSVVSFGRFPRLLRCLALSPPTLMPPKSPYCRDSGKCDVYALAENGDRS